MNQLSDAWPAIALTLKLASLSSFLLLIIATPLAWWLSQTQSLWRKPIGALITLPLVLPPTVLGFYMLALLGPQGWVGQVTQSLGIGVLSFSFTGLLIGSLVFSLPFAVQPIQYAFEAIGKRPLEVAATLRASPIDTFFSVALPLAKPGLLTATVLSFAHTIGEFGVVLMIGGSIPGETKTIAISIYDSVQNMDNTGAATMSLALLLTSLLAITLSYRLTNQKKMR